MENKSINKANVEMAAANIAYVGKAVAYYMNEELKTSQDCAVLMQCFTDIIDGYLMAL